MAGRPMQQHPRSFDDAKLSSMTEPLSIRIERLKGSTRHPIPVPTSEEEEANGKPGGTMWSISDVKGLETWLVTQWAGGGLYEVTITDSGQPNAQVMKWQPYWNPAEYPEKTPPPLVEATRQGQLAQASAPQPVQPSPQQVRAMPAFPHGLPPGYQAPTQQQQPQPFYQQPYYAPMPPPPQVGSPQWSQWQAEAERRERDNEVKRLREEASQRERDAVAAKHAAELERERRSVDDRFSRLEGLIGNLASTLKDAANSKSSSDSPELAALREQNRLLAEERRRAEERAEAERRDAALRDTMRQQAETAQRQIEAMQRQFEATLTQLSANNKHDPIVALMQEQARQHSEAIKEISRQNQSGLERMQSYMMNPRDMIQLARESQQGVDAATDRVVNFFGRVVDTQQKVTENMLAMQPQGSGVVDVVRDGMGAIKEFAERYVGAKTTSERIQASASVEMARAQAAAIHSQAVASNPAAFVQAQPQGLAGVPVAAPASGVPMVEVAGKPSPERLWGRTDQQWFGSILDHVEELRRGVSQFLAACAADPVKVDKDGNIVGISPERAAEGILYAAGVAQQNQLAIPALIELLLPGKYPEFVSVLLPDANDVYRNDVIKNCLKLTGQDDGEDVDLDEDEDEEAEDDAPVNGHNGAAAAKLTPVKSKASALAI